MKVSMYVFYTELRDFFVVYDAAGSDNFFHVFILVRERNRLPRLGVHVR